MPKDTVYPDFLSGRIPGANWPKTTWAVHLQLNNRLHVVGLSADAIHVRDDGTVYTASAPCADLQPFGDLRAMIIDTCIDAAVADIKLEFTL